MQDLRHTAYVNIAGGHVTGLATACGYHMHCGPTRHGIVSVWCHGPNTCCYCVLVQSAADRLSYVAQEKLETGDVLNRRDAEKIKTAERQLFGTNPPGGLGQKAEVRNQHGLGCWMYLLHSMLHARCKN